MTGALLLILWLFGLASVYSKTDYSSDYTDDSSLIVSPKYQAAYEHENVVIDCKKLGSNKIQWKRPNGLPLPKKSFVESGRLHIMKIKYKESGTYICFDELGNNNTAFVEVHRSKYEVNFLKTHGVFATPTYAPFSDINIHTKAPTYTSEVRRITLMNPENPLLRFPEVTNSPYPCLYGICNGTCCKSDFEDFFDCTNGQKINKSLVCNRANDCDDGSDEAICSPWPPKITVLPKSRVEVYCGDQDKRNSGTLILECESVGHPIPLIRWIKYEGHVPSKCQQYSKRGHGILTCPDFQQSDQGAYSCVAENSVKLAESQPKSLAKCSNIISCSGFRVLNEEQIEHCLECYCSGKTRNCQNLKSNPTINKFSFPETQTEIFVKDDGEIVFIPTKTDLTPNYEIRKSSQPITYCALSENELEEKSFVKSFGRNIIIPKYKGKINFLPKASNLIIQGNNISLMYSANLVSPPRNSEMDLSIRLWPGNWHHLNKKEATRKDLMKVLSNVNALYIRCEYQEGKIIDWSENATVFIESSLISSFTNSVSYVEKCNCPIGYDGLSCESCAAGYKKKTKGDDFFCEVITPPPCKEGYKGFNCTDCDTFKGYYKKGNECVKPVCHPDGSQSSFPNYSGKCNCKEGVTGDNCDRCQEDYFYLHKARGCLKCWCSGVTNQCRSSNLYRSVISNIPRGGYNSSDGRNFWLLPSDFSGNQLSSYGGYLNYTMKYKPYIPKENNFLTVELLSKDDVTLIYTHEVVDRSTLSSEKSWSVSIDELKWKKSGQTSVTRGEFLRVLSKIKAIYIESPYHLSSGKANLTSARMSSAGTYGDYDTPLALEVEQCICPLGYTGLSCESCSEGYYRKRNGTITRCIKCSCPYCDPEFGCPDCPPLTYRDNPEEEKMPICKPCPCNGNGISCTKDDHSQIFCKCKSGFTGMHCENPIPTEKDELIVSISPRRIHGKKVGSVVHVNCSFISNENMTLSARNTFRNSKQSILKSSSNDSGLVTDHGLRIWKIFEIVLENELEAVECLVHDLQGKVAGHVIAQVKNLIIIVKPVKIVNCYSDQIVVRESESKDLICEAAGSPEPMINWYKAGKGLPAKKVDTSYGVHTVESVSLNDNGTIYTCIAENSDGDKATCAIVLIVRKKCEIVSVSPKQVREEEGKNISVQCKTTAKSPVKWSIWNAQRESSIFNSRISTFNGLLQITNATLSDSGIYICTAEVESGKISDNVSVVVFEKRIHPVVYIKEDDKVLKRGETFVVNCEATGKPTPTITWVKLNDTLRNNVWTFGKTLTINKATVENSGIYGCEARSVLGNASSYISIEVENVNFPPNLSILPGNITVEAGEEVLVSCVATGYPQPKLSWFASNADLTIISRKNESIAINESIVYVKEIASIKAGKDISELSVSCIAENSAGRNKTTATIKFLQPKTGINETVYFVPIGSNFVLDCEFSGNRVWKKIGGMVGDECTSSHGLIIASVQRQHNGTYICEAEPDFKKVVNLIVTGFVPKFSKELQSYMVLPVRLLTTNAIRIEMSFNATNENGLLLQKENNKLQVYLEKRKINLCVNSSKDNIQIKMNNPIELRKWHSLVVTINWNVVDITIYDENSVIIERQTENSKDLNVTLGYGDDSFFIGGGPITKWRHFKRIFSQSSSYFDGCISRLKIDHHEFNIVKEGTFSHNVTLCRRCSEEQNLCSSKGKCMDAPTQYGFICVCPKESEIKSGTCPAGCVGKGCETQLELCELLKPCNGFSNKCNNKVYSLECQCDSTYSGVTCEKVQKYSFCAKGNGYVRLPSYLLERQLGVKEIIGMSFTLNKRDGLLLWQGDRTNYLSIAVQNGILEYTYLNQRSNLTVRNLRELELNKKHTFLITRQNNTVNLDLNWTNHIKPSPEQYKNFTSKVNTNRVIGDIYLGFVPNTKLHVNPVYPGLDGCIHYVTFGGKAKINLEENQLEEFNIFSPTKLFYNDIDDSAGLDYEGIYSDYE